MADRRPTRPRGAAPWLAVVTVAVTLVGLGCKKDKDEPLSAAPSASTSAPPPASQAVEPLVPSASVAAPGATSAPPLAPRACPPEMVLAGGVCVDRWECQLLDRRSGKLLSPYYPPMPRVAARLAAEWEKKRFETGGPEAQALAVPPLPPWHAQDGLEPVAVSRPGVVPSGYVSGVIAETACANAGKRLCTYPEWHRACRGQQDRDYPYGDQYQPGVCNIFRASHPASVLHDNPSIGHLDPRLNLVRERSGDPLLRPTGGTPRCKSAWGDDAAFDMNGNLDEWVADEKGRFVGGFFSRSKKDGCQSSVGAHPKGYFDYSTGVRCCKDAGGAEGGPEGAPGGDGAPRP